MTYFPDKEKALPISHIGKIVKDSYGMPPSSFQRYKNQLHDQGFISTQGGLWYRVVGMSLPPEDKPQPRAAPAVSTPPAAPETPKLPDHCRAIAEENRQTPREMDRVLLCFPIGEAAACGFVEIRELCRNLCGINESSISYLVRRLETIGAIHFDGSRWYRDPAYVWLDAKGIKRVSAEIPRPQLPTGPRPTPPLKPVEPAPIVPTTDDFAAVPAP